MPLFLLISVSRRWYVQSNGRLDHSQRPPRVSLAALDLVDRLHVVHFFLWDSETETHYAEVGYRGKLPHVTSFLDRALASAGFHHAAARGGIAVPGTVLDVYSEIMPYLASKGFSCMMPIGGFRFALEALREWEDNTFWRLEADVPFQELIFGNPFN